MSLPLRLYLRREPTTDSTALHNWESGACLPMDVVCYATRKTSAGPKARWPWCNRIPRTGCLSVMLNCYRWKAVWLKPLARRRQP